MKISIVNGEISEEEKRAYIAYALEKHRGRQIDELEITLDGEFADLKCRFSDIGFQHAYRSADYLVDSMKKLNDAKQTEFSEKERHSATRRTE